MKLSIVITACAAFGMMIGAADAATIAKKHHAQHAAKPSANSNPEAAPEAAPADAAPAKVIEPDPQYFGHAGSGTKY